MHNTYNLKKGQEFKNDKGGSSKLNKTIKSNEIDSIVNKILLFNPQQTKVDEDVVFILKYDNFVPKTRRFLFINKNEIIYDTDIPWKNISFKKNKKVEIFYKIKEKYWKKFISKIKEINDRDMNNLHEWIDKFIGNEKEYFIKIIDLLSNLNIDNPIEKPIFEYDNKNKSLFYLIELIPLKAEIIFKIFQIINCLDELESEINKNLLMYNTLIISDKTLNSLISFGYHWVIKNNQNKEIYDFKLDIPKEIKEFIMEYKTYSLVLPKTNKIPPFIGIIDSGVNLPEQFNEYITIEKHLEFNKKSHFDHGTIVASLIIANDELNPTYQDGFGNFKVKHFELLGYENNINDVGVSFEHLEKKIKTLVVNNPNIKIWNLSLGGLIPDRQSRLTPIAKIIDSIAEKYNVLFVVASGNDGLKDYLDALNSPADAFNVISVGSNTFMKDKYEKCDYSSSGVVYGYIKPEVSTFGGPYNKDGSPLKALTHNGKININHIQGTSFSTPRITRMAAYLYTKGYTPLEIKAKIINEAKSTDNKQGSKPSAFGCIDGSKKINNFDLKFSGNLINNKPIVWALDLKNVDLVSISAVNFVKYNSLLGDEYSIADLEIDIIQIQKKIIENNTNPILKNDQNFKKTLTKLVKNGEIHKLNKFNNEFYKRTTEGKFFTGKKIIVDLNLEENKLTSDWTYALIVRRNNLIKSENYISNNEHLKYAISINLQGKNLLEEEFIINNSQIIDIENEVIIEN